ncbi:hypothetical protein ACROSR_11110 [Roseovarius tibetensis]|uniref:hypothetical protein n=1 Tax=Roseovarius tibetensis TaxID=2685897 RepID=UPI003D7FF94B
MGGQGIANGPPRLAIAWLTRFPPHLWREGRRLGLLIVGHFFVFLLAIGHDEIVEESVAAGLIAPARTEMVELLMAFVLFLGWTILTIAIVQMVHQARSETARATRGNI